MAEQSTRPSTEFLGYLADSLARAIADNGGAALVHVICGQEGPDVGILPLDGQAPDEVLLGAVAPEHWSALGVAAVGKAMPLEPPADSPPWGDGPARAEVVVLVARDGRVVSRVRQADRVLTEPPGSGLTLDCLQRVMGLPTAPPEVPPAHLLAVIWLERVLAGEGLAGEGLAGADLLAAAEELDRPLGWGRLRQLAMAGAWPELGLTPEEAAWFDDGGFSRRVMARYRPLPVLVAELHRVLRPDRARRCLRFLHRLGVGDALPSAQRGSP